MRKTALNMVYELAKQDDRITFVGSDLGPGTLDGFRKEFPDRFLMEGVNEQHAVGLAAGMALEGKIVYVNTIATFLTRRAYEQVLVDMCLHNLKVRLIGNGGGVVYAPLGSTHLATEDLAAMRAIPNLTIVAPTDADEMRRLMPQTVDWPGPMYIRLAKGHDPIVSRDDIPFVIGKALPMREGRDALIVTTGITPRLALPAAEQLAERGIDAGVLHLPTVKPLDVGAVIDRARRVRAIVTVEEANLPGGLGGAVAEVLMEADFDEVKRFRRIALPDAFHDGYGRQDDLMTRCGVSTERIVEVLTQLLERT